MNPHVDVARATKIARATGMSHEALKTAVAAGPSVEQQQRQRQLRREGGDGGALAAQDGPMVLALLVEGLTIHLPNSHHLVVQVSLKTFLMRRSDGQGAA